eukprot:8311482-Lingulodinium_polyedra.AAC.1
MQVADQGLAALTERSQVVREAEQCIGAGACEKEPGGELPAEVQAEQHMVRQEQRHPVLGTAEAVG